MVSDQCAYPSIYMVLPKEVQYGPAGSPFASIRGFEDGSEELSKQFKFKKGVSDN